MQVAIQLQRGSYDCLMNQVSEKESEARRALKEATKLDNPRDLTQALFTVICGEKLAAVLLETARRSCPQAVHEIELAIQTPRTQPL
jgi:hypothetical protein